MIARDAPPATAALCRYSLRFWSRRPRIGSSGASAGCSRNPGCRPARLGKPSSTTGCSCCCGNRRIYRPGDFVERGVNVSAFGLPGAGKTHALCAIGHGSVESGLSVVFAQAYWPVQDLLAAKRDFDPAASTTPAGALPQGICYRSGAIASRRCYRNQVVAPFDLTPLLVSEA